jgi:hypothetical protein
MKAVPPALAVASVLAAGMWFSASVHAADYREGFGRPYQPPPPPEVVLRETEAVQVDRGRVLPPPPVVQAPLPTEECKVIVRRRVNGHGEEVIRRIRICEEVVGGRGPRFSGDLRGDVYGSPPIPYPPRPVGPEEDFEDGEPG